MVDVLFLILTFFITITAFKEDDTQINVSLPATESARPGTGQRTQIVLTIKDDNTVFMGERSLTLDELRTTLTQLAQQYPNESVLIRGDRESHLGLAVRVMDLAYGSGIRNVFLATTRPKSEVGQ
jgi:biopolymer transport protein ExbD